MGIAYDWVNQRLIRRKTKTNNPRTKTKPPPASNQSRRGRPAILCLGPIATNLRQWHFSFRGAGEGLYSGGIYHGQIVLPRDYPMSPPGVQIWTPSGRFVPHKDICLSASNYHPESWTPRWSIQGIVNALRLHMLTSPNEIGGMSSTRDETLEYARHSVSWKCTWIVGGGSGGSGGKRTKITVDHELMVAEGILSDGETEEETSDDEADDGDETADETAEETPPDPVSEMCAEVSVEENADETAGAEDAATATATSENAVANRNDEKENSIAPDGKFGFSMTAIASVLQLVCLYVIVLLFLNR